MPKKALPIIASCGKIQNGKVRSPAISPCFGLDALPVQPTIRPGPRPHGKEDAAVARQQQVPKDLIRKIPLGLSAIREG